MGNKFYVFFLVVIATLNLCTLDNFHNWGDDFSLYLHESKAIISNDLFNLQRINSDMMAFKKIGPNLYPIGYPLILTPLLYFKANFLIIKLLHVCFLVGIIMLVKNISRRFFDESQANVSALLFGTSSFIFFSTNEILSDLPALFFALFVLLSILRWRYEDKFSAQNYLLYFVFSICTLLTRTAYLTFFVGIIFAFLVDGQLAKNKNWKAFLTEICFATLPVIIIQILNKLLIISDGSNESKELVKTIFNLDVLINVFQSNISYYFGLFSLGLLSPKLLILILLIPIYLYRRFWFKKADLIENNESGLRLNRYLFLTLIFLSTISVFIIWPSKQGYRFILLNMVMLFIFTISSLNNTPLWFRKCLALSYLYLFIVTPLISRLETNYSVHKTISLQRFVKKGEPGTREFNSMIDYIKTKTPPNSLIYFSKPRALHYFSGRKSYFINNQNHLKSGDWILIWNEEGLEALQSKFTHKLQLSYRSGGLQLFRLV